MSQPPNQPPPGPRQPPPGQPNPQYHGSSQYQPDPRYAQDPRYRPQPPYPQQQAQLQPRPPSYPPRPQPSVETRRDVEAAWQARLELGLDFEEHIAAGLAERVEELAEARARELGQQANEAKLRAESERAGRGRQLSLAITSMVFGVPITAIAATQVEPSLFGVAVCWAGIVGVNAIHALGLRRRRS
jgi:hypothetical protein